MQLTVSPDPQNPTRGTLTCGTAAYPCALGRSGVSAEKKEGDGATPVGTFALRRVFFRADRLQRPKTHLPMTAANPHDGWCDAPYSASYNQIVRMPFPDSAENLWRDDAVYDVVVVIGYNDAPVIPGKGSAIFMHVARPGYAPTEGCVALQLEDLLKVLEHLTPTSTITIEQT
ncbi:MAG: L,D-transpeptidase family protein [Rhodospirillaceae bacterium]|nr:L,D-transpeptidase family protein [Rhodospirillaceae bacterium]